MTKKRKKFRFAALGATVALMAGTLVASQVLPVAGSLFGGPSGGSAESGADAETPVVTEYTGKIDTGIRSKLDEKVVQPLPDGLASDDEISVIVETSESALLQAFDGQSSVSRYATVADFAASSKGQDIARRVGKLNERAKTLIERSGAKFTYGAEYDMLLGGFEVVMKASEYGKFSASLRNSGFKASVSEVYEVAEAKVVDNPVKIHEDTGIFDNMSDELGYDGSGTVIAVLDTGLDYTHTAFDPKEFTSKKITMTQEKIASKIPDLRAAQFTERLSAANVYINEKVPYAYDYADKDTNVYPFGGAHGVHVSGIIVGNDDVIKGVAPNAQLVSMKVFSDTDQGARWSWILAALEDCVTLEVDVVNMSLGSSAGFTREDDETQAKVYDSLAEHGISLVAAASNDYNSTFGSVKNGNLGLTSSPDSATVGSPGSYASALAVASISGVKTPYLTHNGHIMYFTESADASSKPRDFVDDILPDNEEKKDFEYVRIPGIGRSGDYDGIDVEGKIALVRRGDTTFEEKARIAQNKRAAGVIIYNNVSGDITMTVGSVTIPVCSVSQDNGEILAASSTGTITISRSQVAGPFMSDFSSWGPTPDLRIKPEITAHGGDILSSVPGQDYDRLSGTSMASPNQAGVTALVRQYVAEKFPDASRQDALGLVNRIMMSTADIAYNINGLPYSVRKQGAGLANLKKATSSPAYISTYERNDAAIADGTATESAATRFTDKIMDKAKIEFGDKGKDVYELKFDINNISENSVSYNVGAIVMTEGISKTKTHKGDTTVTEEGYLFDDADLSVVGVTDGTHNGTVVTVAGKGKATVVVRIKLSDSDIAYLDQFANGMYVEGYVTLKPTDGNTVSLNVPYLAFYGDWTKAPIFDLDYFETDKDDRDDSIETLDKTLPDVFASIPLGGLYNDYISSLGSYYFIQESNGTQISADRKYVSLTNQTGETGGVNSIYGIYAGMLRGAKRLEMTITDSSTGEVIWKKTEYNQRKSASGTSVSVIDVDFHLDEYDLKNNTQYLFRIEGFLDYPGEQNNLKNVFEFPFVADFSAPVLTDVDFYTEYDNDLKKDRLYARMYVYDNHYAMAYQAGRVYTENDGAYLDLFSRLPTPIHSEFNSTSEVIFEVTDYVERLSGSYRPNTFIVELYDYAMNTGIFEVKIPDSVRYLYFSEMEKDGEPIGQNEFGVTLSPNQYYTLDPVVYPRTEWKETLRYSVEPGGENVVRIVNGKILALGAGTATVTATCSTDASVHASLTVKVLSSTDPGYQYYDKPVAETFRLTGYTTDYAFYFPVNSDRDISVTGALTIFSPNATSYALSMYPSEKVTLNYELSAYYPQDTEIRFESGNENIAKIDEKGQITAVAEGVSMVSVRVFTKNADGSYSSTLHDIAVSITVKDPYTRNGPYLTRYTGGGDAEGKVVIPEELGFTEISQYAFSGYSNIPKDLSAGDVIDEEDPYYTKPWYYGDNPDVKTVVIPEGVEVIGNYAFAGMTSLRKVVLPSTLNKISAGAFYGCTSLEEIEGLQYVKFITKDAFSGPLATDASGRSLGYYLAPGLSKVQTFKGENGTKISPFASIVAIGDSAFRGTKLTTIDLPASAQSIGAYAFADTNLFDVKIAASKIKLGSYAFAGCVHLTEISVNASVVPDGVFEGCRELTTVTLGADVESIGVAAFSGTQVSSFNVRNGNKYFRSSGAQSYILNKDGDTLVYVAPVVKGGKFELKDVRTVGANAFSGNTQITSVTMPAVTRVENYAFYGCENLVGLKLGNLEEIGEYAFTGCPIRTLPAFADTLQTIGAYAFASTGLTSVTIGENVTVEEGAFRACSNLQTVTVGAGSKLGAYAFAAYYGVRYVADPSGENYDYDGQLDPNQQIVRMEYLTTSILNTANIGENVEIGPYAFFFDANLEKLTLGKGTSIGEGAFYNASSLDSVDLKDVVSIGDGAFFSEVVKAYLETNDEGTVTREYVGTFGAHWGAQLTEIDLSGLESLGAAAFSGVQTLKTVTLGENLSAIPEEAFYETAITSIDLSNITEIGAGAFYASGLMNADISRAGHIGALAFAGTQLANVVLCEGAVIDDRAFYSCANLGTVGNLDKAVKIGEGAFAGTALSGQLDLSSALTIGDFAFMDTKVTGVRFSEDLASGVLPNGEQAVLGENPFEGCPLQPLTETVEETFHGTVVGSSTTDTFDINENVKVIGGALYHMVPNGLELVSYPVASGATEYEVPEGTVRISAGAFDGAAALRSVILPSTLLAIGDRAFFDCTSLQIVTFKSLKAPILEEQYDAQWGNGMLIVGVAEDGNYIVNHPGVTVQATGATIYGLGIVKYNMWNLTPPNYFYGANFKGVVGVIEPDLVMVRPSNGVNYESFTFGLYFGRVIDGAVAAESFTLDAIAAIKALPESVDLSLSHKPLVVEARRLYDLIGTAEQQALVAGSYDGTDYYGKLTSAENTIAYLEGQDSPSKPGDQPSGPEGPAAAPSDVNVTLAVFVGVFGFAFIAAVVLLFVEKSKKPASAVQVRKDDEDFGNGQNQNGQNQ